MKEGFILSLNVLIIGAGQIAAGYDSPSSTKILTHAHAIHRHPGFNLIGFYDTDKKKAAAAAKKWNSQAFDNLSGADILVICTPDSNHLDSIRQAVALAPKLIILEKPIASNYNDAEQIISAVRGLPTQVNLSRRFIREFQALSLDVKYYGTFLAGTGYYGKGFVHNGSHMIDLLKMLLGEIISVTVLNEFHDYSSDDLTKDVMIHYNNGGEFYMKGINCNLLTIFELDLIFEKARVKILDSGERIQIFRLSQSEKYQGYINFTNSEEIRTEIDNAMYNLYQNIYDFVIHNAELLSPIENALTKEVYSI